MPEFLIGQKILESYVDLLEHIEKNVHAKERLFLHRKEEGNNESDKKQPYRKETHTQTKATIPIKKFKAKLSYLAIY